MTFRTRIRKIVKWTALAMTAVFLVCWIGSNWYYLMWTGISNWRGLGCNEGIAWGGFGKDALGLRYYSLKYGRNYGGDPFNWWGFSYELMTLPAGTIRVFKAPLWAPLLLAGGVAFAAWRLDSAATRRASTGLCKKCGYHRAGLKPDALCPECGVGVKA